MNPSTEVIQETGRTQYKCPRCNGLSKPMNAKHMRKDLLKKLDDLFDQEKPKYLSQTNKRLNLLVGVYAECIQETMDYPKQDEVSKAHIARHLEELTKIQEWCLHFKRLEDQNRFRGKWMNEYRRTARSELARIRSYTD